MAASMPARSYSILAQYRPGGGGGGVVPKQPKVGMSACMLSRGEACVSYSFANDSSLTVVQNSRQNCGPLYLVRLCLEELPNRPQLMFAAFAAGIGRKRFPDVILRLTRFDLHSMKPC